MCVASTWYLVSSLPASDTGSTGTCNQIAEAWGVAMIMARSASTLGCVQLKSVNHVAKVLALLADSLNHPVLLAEGAPIVLLHPKGHAAVMEGMVTLSPNNCKTGEKVVY